MTDGTVTLALLAAHNTAGEDLRWCALSYALDFGLEVFPCREGGKVPRTRHGFKDATTDADVIERWWSEHPNDNIATPTGRHFDVLDVDVRADESGYPELRILREAGLIPAGAPIVQTRNGGLHVYVAPSGHGGGSVGRLDYKATGGYVLLPPSTVPADDGVPNGTGRYEWVQTGNVGAFDWQAAKGLLRPPKPPRETPPKGGNGSGLVATLAAKKEGERNVGLHWAACRAWEEGLSLDPIREAALSAGLEPYEVDATIASARQTVGRG